MSGGFFRGTSADQDTRFSNKQAKLLKSQKFAPELDHLVDVTKVKMDVVKPWIASRVTEILGFEDEVLINFIYGLLDKKLVNGKEIQIQITGFMEKNTGKFMKELWVLLLSAQENASGVPQQFLDAKEEEIRKKKAEADRITHEIQKKKAFEQEKLKKMDSEVHVAGDVDEASDSILKHLPWKASSPQPEGDKESDEMNGSGGKNSDRSISRSPQSRGHSISPRQYRSPRKHSLSPHKYSPRRPWSPFRWRSPHSRRRSLSPRRRGSSSLVQHRSPSPRRHRSPSPVRRRSPTPVRHRYPPPMRRRSPSPLLRRRSPSPMRRRSSLHSCRRLTPQRRSPPLRWRSPSPSHRSPSLVRMRSPPSRSPKERCRSPVRHPRQRNRIHRPYKSRSPAYRSCRSLSGDRDIPSNGVGSKRYRDDYASKRAQGRRSPVHHALEREEVELSVQGRYGPDPTSRQLPISLRSPQRDPRYQSDACKKIPAQSLSPEKSPSRSESSPHTGQTSPSDDRSSFENTLRQTQEQITHAHGTSPMRKTRDRAAHHDNPETDREEETSHPSGSGVKRTDSPRERTRHSPTIGSQRKITMKDFHREECLPERLDGRRSGEARGHQDFIQLRKKDGDRKSEKVSTRTGHPRSPQLSSHMVEDMEYGPGRIERERLSLDRVPYEWQSAKQLERDIPSNERAQKSHSRKDYRTDEKKLLHLHDVEATGEMEPVQKSVKNVGHNSDSEHIEKRKHKRSKRHEVASDSDASYDSQMDGRKEAKRRKKEEKRRLRKEERCRHREERHRRREERRACKLKTKSVDTVTPPSDIDKSNFYADVSDGDTATRRGFQLRDTKETKSKQKKLEIELRRKALESLRAKKAINP